MVVEVLAILAVTFYVLAKVFNAMYYLMQKLMKIASYFVLGFSCLDVVSITYLMSLLGLNYDKEYSNVETDGRSVRRLETEINDLKRTIRQHEDRAKKQDDIIRDLSRLIRDLENKLDASEARNRYRYMDEQPPPYNPYYTN